MLPEEDFESRPKKSLRVGPANGSLMDDDDDELVDYFGISGDKIVPTRQSVPAPNDVLHSSSEWNVHDCNIRALPLFYLLEKSSVFVPQALANSVSTRITTVLQARSTVASYDTQNAKADCVSKSNVAFRIRLYRRRGDECENGIIVEIQRREGFHLSFTRDVFAILDAAAGKDVSEPIYQEEIHISNSTSSDNAGFSYLSG
jgi:hypothetical protein